MQKCKKNTLRIAKTGKNFQTEALFKGRTIAKV